MKHELAVQTTARNQMLDLTSDLSGLVAQFGLEDGYLIVYVPHTTAAVTILSLIHISEPTRPY